MYDNGKTFLGFSLVDITPTGVIRDLPGQELERNQQRNWETVLQCIGLRAQPIEAACRVDELDLKKYEFGSMFEGNHRVWSFEIGRAHV